MQYPKLRELKTNRQIVDTFRGYNHNLRISDGEFFDMKNMTSDYYPILAPRGKRGVFLEDIHGEIISKENLCYVKDGGFHIAKDRVTEFVMLGLKAGQKQLISMGAYVIIMPDKKWVNTATLEFGDIEQSNTSQANVSFELCTITGDAYSGVKIASTAPADPKDQELWIDTSSVPHTLKRYSGTSEMWVAIATTYVKISSKWIGYGLKQYDGVTISGIKNEALQSLNGSHVLWGAGNDYIIVTGIIDVVANQALADGAITVERKMPEMDFVIESENRLWGCRYGTAANGQMVNEIYASKLGDFKNWSCFMGLSTDSYTASCGTDGPFTGAITHLGYPLFFKENCVHKVYGNYPANFQIQTTACRGVQRGSHRSLAIVNETLFYKSRGAVCAYDGSLPVEVSYALGNQQYSAAVAGSHGNKYYISMNDYTGTWHLFVYDVAKGMWHKEDNIQVDCFCSHKDELYAVEHDTGNIITMLSSNKKPEDRVKWMAQTGPIGTDMPDMKYISRLTIRMSMGLGTRVRFLIQYDSMGGWEHLCTMTGTNLRSFSIPIRPRRCDHLRLRIEGEGEARIYSITKTIEQGSDIS